MIGYSYVTVFFITVLAGFALFKSKGIEFCEHCARVKVNNEWVHISKCWYVSVGICHECKEKKNKNKIMLGEVLIDMGFITKEQLDKAIEKQSQYK